MNSYKQTTAEFQMSKFNYQQFKQAEEKQSAAYAAETKGFWKKALAMHLQAEVMFRKIGETERANESEMAAACCAANI